MRTLGDLVAGVGLLLDGFDLLRVGRLLLRLDHVGRAGLGGGREAAQRGQRRCAIRVQALGLQLGLGQEHLPLLHLLLQLVVVWLRRKQERVSRQRGQQGALSSNHKTTHLLPGVQPQGGDTHLLDVVFSWSEQQVPVRFGWKRDLQAGVTGSAGSKVLRVKGGISAFIYGFYRGKNDKNCSYVQYVNKTV